MHKVVTSDVTPITGTCKPWLSAQVTRESLIAQTHNSAEALVKRVLLLNYGNCYCFQAVKVKTTVVSLCDILYRFMRESLIAQIRNPAQAFVKRVRAINYGNCYYFQSAELKDLDNLDVDAACDHFNQCYQNPAEFTVCLTGQIDVSHYHKCYVSLLCLQLHQASQLHYPGRIWSVLSGSC